VPRRTAPTRRPAAATAASLRDCVNVVPNWAICAVPLYAAHNGFAFVAQLSFPASS
jgi:hypothetical protein